MKEKEKLSKPIKPELIEPKERLNIHSLSLEEEYYSSIDIDIFNRFNEMAKILDVAPEKLSLEINEDSANYGAYFYWECSEPVKNIHYEKELKEYKKKLPKYKKDLKKYEEELAAYEESCKPEKDYEFKKKIAALERQLDRLKKEQKNFEKDSSSEINIKKK